jgi:hypothetical protein
VSDTLRLAAGEIEDRNRKGSFGGGFYCSLCESDRSRGEIQHRTGCIIRQLRSLATTYEAGPTHDRTTRRLPDSVGASNPAEDR